VRLFNPSEKRIIEFLLTGEKTLPEIAQRLQLSKPGTSKYLKTLEDSGLVTGAYERTAEGRTVRYHLQPFHLVLSLDPASQTAMTFLADDVFDPDFPFLGFIPQKELRDDVKRCLEELQKKQLDDVTVVLYGSVATGIATRKSDIDLLFVKESWTKQQQDACLEAVAEASETILHPMKPRFLTPLEFDTMDPALQKEIKDQGVVIFESGGSWKRIQQQLRRYTSITI